MPEKGTWTVKKGLAEMLKGGVIMDVTNPEQARIAEEAGACAVMALERVPADIRAAGGVARMADPSIILRIMDSGDHPGDGQGADRPLRGGADPGGPGSRLYRRERSADPGRRGLPYRQGGLQGPVRLRGAQPGRGAAEDRGRGGHDPHQGRARDRQRGGGG